MDLSELQKEVDRDIKIDDTELDIESIRTPQLHNKYLKYYTEYSLRLRQVKDEYKYLRREKWEYYTGKAQPIVYEQNPFDLKILKSDIYIYLEADRDLQEVGQKEAYLETVVSYLEKILREITNRNWTIRNTIEWKKFLHGE